MFRLTLGLTGLVSMLVAPAVWAAQPTITPAMRPFVSQDASVIALVHARVIDGTGMPAKNGYTLVLENGDIEAVGPDGSLAIPAGAKVIDLTGKSVLPGLVQMHEHLYFNPGTPLSPAPSFAKLYLAAGVTSIRTAGSFNDYYDLKLRDDVEAGRAVGPWMDLSIYMDLGGPHLKTAADTDKYLNFWIDSGFTSVKAYSNTYPVAVEEGVKVAHAHGLKMTGHLCMTTYRQAAEFGIDNIEHGFAMAPDFLKGDEAPKTYPSGQVDPKAEMACRYEALDSLKGIDPEGPEVKSLVSFLIQHKVAITSTLPPLEDLVADIPEQTGTDMLTPPLQDYYRQYRAKMKDPNGGLPQLAKDSLRKTAVIEKDFMHAGGLLLSGSDPATPSGGVVPGYANDRQLELMVQFGFTPLEAIRVATLNGATYLGRQDRIGSIAAGKQADLLVVDGDPTANISDIRKVVVVFKQGIGYDPEKLRASVKGKVGL